MAFVLVFASCAVNDDDPVVASQNDEVGVYLSKTGQINTTDSNGVSVDIELTEVIGADTNVEYLLNGNSRTAIVPAGSNKLTLTLSSGVGVVNSLKLNKAISLYSNAKIDETRDEVVFVGLPEPSPTMVKVLMIHNDGTNNLWLGVSQFTSDGTWVADYEGSNNTIYPRLCEIPLTGVGTFGTIPNSVDINPNMIALNLYTRSTLTQDPTNYNIFVVMPNGDSQSFSGTVGAVTATDNAVVKIDVSPDSNTPGNRLFVFSEL